MCIILCVCMYDRTVPTPALTLSVPSGPLYEGTSQTLTCTITLPDTVDTDLDVFVQWTLDTTSDHVSISAVSSMRSPFISTLTLSPLSMTDATQYSCMATADSASQYITASIPGQSSVETITVTGMTTELHRIVMHTGMCIHVPFQLCHPLVSLSHSLEALLLVKHTLCSVQLVWWMVWWYCLT